MAREMMSFHNFGPEGSFDPMTDISSLPDDYNKTDTEIVEMGGKRFLKKTTTLKKGRPGSTFFVRSTTFLPVNETENADIPATDEEGKERRPALVPLPGNASEPTPVTPSGDSSSSRAPDASFSSAAPEAMSPASSDLKPLSVPDEREREDD